MRDEKEQALLQAARQKLDDLEHDLDPSIAARLRGVRRQALSTGDHKRYWWQRRQAWMPLGTLATGFAVFAIAAIVWLSVPTATLVPPVMEDLELLAAQDNIEFYGDLEFYYWLATINDAG